MDRILARLAAPFVLHPTHRDLLPHSYDVAGSYHVQAQSCVQNHNTKNAYTAPSWSTGAGNGAETWLTTGMELSVNATTRQVCTGAWACTLKQYVICGLS